VLFAVGAATAYVLAVGVQLHREQLAARAAEEAAAEVDGAGGVACRVDAAIGIHRQPARAEILVGRRLEALAPAHSAIGGDARHDGAFDAAALRFVRCASELHAAAEGEQRHHAILASSQSACRRPTVDLSGVDGPAQAAVAAVELGDVGGAGVAVCGERGALVEAHRLSVEASDVDVASTVDRHRARARAG
jgi:hypothetical protein